MIAGLREWARGPCHLVLCTCSGTGREKTVAATLSVPDFATYEICRCEDCGHVARFEFKRARP